MTEVKRQVLIVAGEASGDLHGASLVSELRKRDKRLVFFGIGGDGMKKAGVELVHHVREMAFLGFFEVVRHLPLVRRVFRETRDLLEYRKPVCVILIDYPGFNLRLAREAKRRGIPVFYYIGPQVWAWGRGRVKKMARCIDRIAVIFPFEEAIYREAGLPVDYVGHPLKERVKASLTRAAFFRRMEFRSHCPTLGLLPGSRLQEVRHLLPEMLRACTLLRRSLPRLQVVLGMSPTLSLEDYAPFLPGDTSVRPVRGRTYDVMGHSDAVLVASGTATLETAILETPMVILYRMAPLSYLLGRLLVKIPRIGLANIVADRPVVPELIQHRARAEHIAETVRPLLLDAKVRARIRKELRDVSRQLGKAGASARAAQSVFRLIGPTSLARGRGPKLRRTG